MNSKIIKCIIGSIFTIVIVLLVAYKINSPILSIFLPARLKAAYISAQLHRYFPETIDSYALSTKYADITAKHVCNKIENNQILKEYGRTGDACMDTFSVEYRDQKNPSIATSSLVRLNASRFVKEPDIFEILIDKTALPYTLDGTQILRLTPTQIGWSPSSIFDFIVLQEGTITYGTSSDGAPFEKIEYSATTTGDNAVTRHLISKYPPKK
jgi:hypothetical protein